MSILSRISSVTRAGLEDLQRRTLGRGKPSLSDLSDAQLEEELLRRRRLRARRRAPDAADDSPQNKTIAQCYANLELPPGTGLEEVKIAYRRLMRKYHPDKHTADPERHRAAEELARELTRSYGMLVEHLSK